MTTPPLSALRRSALTALLALLVAAGSAPVAAADEPWPPIPDGHIVLFRHAEAPGVGDPPGFTLDDCRTQRNLDDAGRAQARRMGVAVRARGVPVGTVLASPWCRTRETAELAFPGQVKDDARFQSFFGERSREPAQTAAALALLSGWRGPGVLVVVTHQVNISALTGVYPASGEGVVLKPQGDGVAVVGRIRP